MEVNLRCRRGDARFRACQPSANDVRAEEEAELRRLEGHRAPIPACRAATGAAAEVRWFVPAVPVANARTSAEGAGEGSGQAREGNPSGSNTDNDGPGGERTNRIPQHIGRKETAPTLPQPSATRRTGQEVDPRYESLFRGQVQTRSANTDVAVVVAVAVAAVWTHNASAHAASSTACVWQVAAEKLELARLKGPKKEYRTTFRAYGVYHKTKYGVDYPSIEALGDEWAFLPLLTPVQAIEFMEAYAFDEAPFGQATWGTVQSS